MEQLLHYVWRHQIVPLQPLRTTDGQPVEVLHPGLPNRHAGPDFTGAKVRIGEVIWAGQVEIHLRSSDWLRHGHQHDKAYDSVILHVVSEADMEVRRTGGEPIPQLVLPIPEEVRLRYHELRVTEVRPPCYTVVPDLSRLTVHSWLSALVAERYEQRAAEIEARRQRMDLRWDDAFFVTLARNFGFGVNGDAFEDWACRMPWQAVAHHRDDLTQVEALFLGLAGLLEQEEADDDYYQKLQREYRYLSHKFSLPEPMPAERWKLLRLRPDNFPYVRLAQLAWLYHRHNDGLLSRLMATETLESARDLLRAQTSPYWESHFRPGRTSPLRKKQVGKNALNLLLINTVIPFLYAYGRHKAQEELCERAGQWLEALPAEHNYITRMWDGAGLPIHTAADSQAIIQLQRRYCDRRDCLRCQFGYQYLNGRPVPTKG